MTRRPLRGRPAALAAALAGLALMLGGCAEDEGNDEFFERTATPGVAAPAGTQNYAARGQGAPAAPPEAKDDGAPAPTPPAESKPEEAPAPPQAP
jgi:hypothetical protein